jgi:hypothetical protein
MIFEMKSFTKYIALNNNKYNKFRNNNSDKNKIF